MYQDADPRISSIEPQPIVPSHEAQLERSISTLLQCGVWLSSLIVLIGGVLYLMRHGSESVDYRVFRGEPAMYRSLPGIITSMLTGHRRGIIQFGLVVLIATPILRVLLCFIAFLRWRDFTYLTITALVLSGLIYSFVGAYF
ncbi:DUF1634 domain-containing protein [Leptolyngbya sp. NIES-2104]|uniref:DUF1634 domain-containing protein n=1 Tax=Leptolyngbya sp. NIES-2104 TaxID=1552121 RepID=UPI0006EC971A|nr:DUF1634 domain-containing protein [Leptolyngbya sp. NIES-2104]GAP94163.1 hypothetical protein NIES2104_06730 [Leptolyngbya sp. NIES-2104]